MLTNNDTKLINSLVKKKFRQKYNKFIVEGVKIIEEVLESDTKIEKIYTTEPIFDTSEATVELITERELKKISQLIQPNTALAVCEIPDEQSIDLNGFVLALDDVRDPGNLGTIIRLADWFGIGQIICSNETVDLYNSKVIQATMGSFLRVQVNYTNLNSLFSSYKNPILGTFMSGDSIYQSEFPKQAIMLMGNEANGISNDLEEFITKKINIPRFGNSQQIESLNVAMATSIFLSERASQVIKSK